MALVNRDREDCLLMWGNYFEHDLQDFFDEQDINLVYLLFNPENRVQKLWIRLWLAQHIDKQPVCARHTRRQLPEECQ
jgi:hypothetical protein